MLQATYGHELIVLEGGARRDDPAPRALSVEVLDFLIDPLRSGIDRRALFELAMVGSLCGALGFWVLTERLAYSAESLSHGLLPGLVLAALAGAPLLLGAAGGALVAAALIAFASRDARVGPDTGTAIAVTGLVGLGALLALAPEAPQRLEELLFGDPLGVTGGDLLAAALLLVLGGAALAALHRPLSALAFDPAGAAAAGIRPGTMRFALLILLAAAVAVAVQGLGALLVLAVLIGAADGGPRPRAHPRPRDARRSRGRGGGLARRHRGLLPRPQRGRRLRGTRPVRGGGPGSRAQAVAACGTRAAHGHDRGAQRHQHKRDELRLGEPGHHLVVAADELDEKALDARPPSGRARTARPARTGPAAATAPRPRCPWRASRRPGSDGPCRSSAPSRPDRTSPTAGRSGCRSRRRPTAGSRIARSRIRSRAERRRCRRAASRGSRATGPRGPRRARRPPGRRTRRARTRRRGCRAGRRRPCPSSG